MTVSNTPTRFSQLGNGVTIDFPVNFPFQSTDDLRVTTTNMTTGVIGYPILGADYTVEGTTDDLGHWPIGAVVTFINGAPSATERVTIWLEPPIEQTLNLTENNSLPAESLEAALDYLCSLIRRIGDQVNRTVRQPDADGPPIGTLPTESARADKYLYFNNLGELTCVAGPVLTTPESVGNWTPSVGGNTTYSVQLGRYVKRGSVVTVTCYLWIGALGTGSTYQISGLPFAPMSNTPFVAPVMFVGLAAPVVSLVAHIVPGQSAVALMSHTTASTGLSPLGVLGNGSIVYFSGTYLV